jgi:hypothetical protein
MATRAKQKAAEKVAEVISRESVATMVNAPIRLCDLDHKTQAHLYCHREKGALAYSDDGDSFMTRIVESLLSEGQQVPCEYFRDKAGQAILLRGYQRVTAIWHIVERRLDPERFGAEMLIDAVEVQSATPQDLLVRSVSDNEVRRSLSESEQYVAARQMIAAGVSAQRAARALGMSPTGFARLYRRIQNPTLQEHVTQGHLTQTDLDNLLEAAASHGRVEQLETTLADILARAKAHVDRRRAQALAAGEEFDEEKEGKLKQYIKPELIKNVVKAVKEDKAVEWAGPDQQIEGAWVCKINSAEGLIQVSSLKRNLHKVTAAELGKIAYKLDRTARQADRWLQRKLAEEGLAQTTASDEGEDYATFLEKRNAVAEAAKVRKEMQLARGEADPAYGKSAPRAEEDLAASIEVPPAPEFDPMIDG